MVRDKGGRLRVPWCLTWCLLCSQSFPQRRRCHSQTTDALKVTSIDAVPSSSTGTFVVTIPWNWRMMGHRGCPPASNLLYADAGGIRVCSLSAITVPELQAIFFRYPSCRLHLHSEAQTYKGPSLGRGGC
ncbi:hypothetical protein DFH94DRAFT_494038 [Russula ochroleuca]|uniref:Uncharacterized protein n=1 Tax=Russula ochroleuca TaxID=152965 RepID=A0A9P5T984_9AGAM|nr:hypothetical protein DFH94DRAFT_494038 [Russula ochroleuca]